MKQIKKKEGEDWKKKKKEIGEKCQQQRKNSRKIVVALQFQ